MTKCNRIHKPNRKKEKHLDQKKDRKAEELSLRINDEKMAKTNNIFNEKVYAKNEHKISYKSLEINAKF